MQDTLKTPAAATATADALKERRKHNYCGVPKSMEQWQMHQSQNTLNDWKWTTKANGLDGTFMKEKK